MEALGAQEMPVLGIEVEERLEMETPMKDMGDLASMVEKHFEIARQGRLTKEQELIEDLRAWKGEYGPDVDIQEKRSRIFVKLTRAWCGGARSLILTILGQDEGFPWTIDPSPLPELDGLNVDALQEAAQMAAQMMPPEQAEGFLEAHDFDSLAKQAKSEASERCDRMKMEIADQMAEMKWDTSFNRAISPWIIFGTMVVKGPTSAPKRPKRWAKGVDGSWKLALQRWKEGKGTIFDLRPEMEPLDIFSVYPDPVATSIEKAEFIIVRHTPTRHELRSYKQIPGFFENEIETVLLEHAATGDWTPEAWESIVDAVVDQTPTARQHDRFTIKEWWGFLSGRNLRDHGIQITDDLLEAEALVNLWVCCGKVIKCTVSNLSPARLPFHFVPYEDVPGSIWGQGVPRQMDDSQALYNACERAKVDNMGMASGPQVVVDLSRSSDREEAKRIYPWKQWAVSDMEGLTQPPVQFFQPQSNVPHMQAMQADVRLHLQKETNLPDFAVMGGIGSQSHNRTAEGLSMQQNAALAFIRTVIGNLDTFLTQPMIESLYHWNMAFNPREGIKGDYDVVAKGVSGAMTREILTQRLNQLLIAAGNPEIRPWVKVDKAVQLWARAMGYSDLDLTYNEKEVAANRQAELQQQAEADAAPKRIQPIMPRENAVMEMLGNTPTTSPMYGPMYTQAAQMWGLMNPRLGAALNAWSQGQTQAVSPLISPEDNAIMQSDLAPEEINAQPTRTVQHFIGSGGDPAGNAGPGEAPGMGTAGMLPAGMQGGMPPQAGLYGGQ